MLAKDAARVLVSRVEIGLVQAQAPACVEGVHLILFVKVACSIWTHKHLQAHKIERERDCVCAWGGGDGQAIFNQQTNKQK